MKAVNKRQKQTVNVKRRGLLFIKWCFTLVHIFKTRCWVFLPSPPPVNISPWSVGRYYEARWWQLAGWTLISGFRGGTEAGRGQRLHTHLLRESLLPSHPGLPKGKRFPCYGQTRAQRFQDARSVSFHFLQRRWTLRAWSGTHTPHAALSVSNAVIPQGRRFTWHPLKPEAYAAASASWQLVFAAHSGDRGHLFLAKGPGWLIKLLHLSTQLR